MSDSPHTPPPPSRAGPRARGGEGGDGGDNVPKLRSLWLPLGLAVLAWIVFGIAHSERESRESRLVSVQQRLAAEHARLQTLKRTATLEELSRLNEEIHQAESLTEDWKLRRYHKELELQPRNQGVREAWQSLVLRSPQRHLSRLIQPPQ